MAHREPPNNPISTLIHQLHQRNVDDDEPCPDWCPLHEPDE